jgi:hypothetical protein
MGVEEASPFRSNAAAKDIGRKQEQSMQESDESKVGEDFSD